MDHDAGMADHHCGLSFPPELPEFQLHAYREHGQANADLAEQLQRAQGIGREDKNEEFWCQQSQQRRTEQCK